jgi:uncharacterized protein YcbK (DUF882 family)
MTEPANNRVERRVPAARNRGPRLLTGVAAFAAALGVVNFYNPPHILLSAPFSARVARDSVAPPAAVVDGAAFGKSGGLNVRFALPNDTVTYPVAVSGGRRPLLYQWVRLDNQSVAAGAPRALVGTTLVAPSVPGFYQLSLVSGDVRRMLDAPTLAVKVPFARKLAGVLNGYRIGTYLAERLGGGHEQPDGFVEVAADQLDLPLSKHFRLGDFLTHDSQSTWPRYTAVSPRLLDKLELVLAEVARVNGRDPQMSVTVEVNSGFRTPLHNRGVKYAAGDSRHQYGDAADVKIDANFDGRFTAVDARLVAMATEMVEREHPELTGGIGLYTSRRYTTPYVHIDARGKRARWRS